jgi:hypothetical protein
MSASAGTYSLIGSDAVRDFQVTAVSGNYALNGQTVTFRGQRYISVQFGTYNLTGQDSSLRNFKLASVFGTYNLTGTTAALYYTPLGGFGSSARRTPRRIMA